MLLQSLYLPPLSSSSHPLNPKLHRRRRPSHSPSSSPPPQPHFLLRFRISRRQNAQYLRSLGIDTSTSADALDQILDVVNYLKYRGFSDSDFPRLSFLCPQIFSSGYDATNALDLIFTFLDEDLSASPEQARGLISRCPELLVSNVEYRLRPTLDFLRELGVKDLNCPSTLNAHLLNTPIQRLVSKVRILEDLGFSSEESAQICARFPAIFGYSEEYNLRPKVKYLVGEMERSIEEVWKFPQYFAFSLEKRIVPRHVHLKERNVRVPLQKMLMLSDLRFYAKWK